MNNLGSGADEESYGSDSEIWAQVNRPSNNSNAPAAAPSPSPQEPARAEDIQEPEPPKKRLLNVKFCIRGEKPVKGALAMIIWCNDYKEAFKASEKALCHYLPTAARDWKWWLAISDLYDFTSLAEVTPGVFTTAMQQEKIVLFLCGNTGVQDIILYNNWPETNPDQYSSMNFIVVGGEGVGRTSFIRRFSTGRFIEQSDTTPEWSTQSVRRFATRAGDPIQIVIQDIPSQESDEALSPTVFLGISGAFVLYDITKAFKQDDNEFWAKVVNHFDEDVPIMLAGTKPDQIRDKKVCSKDLLKFYEKCEIFAEVKVSNKTGENVDMASQELVEEGRRRIKKASPHQVD